MNTTSIIGGATFWYAMIAIVLVAIVYEANPRWGGVLLIIVVFLMLGVAAKAGTLASLTSSVSPATSVVL